jgi:hypothetical protein
VDGDFEGTVRDVFQYHYRDLFGKTWEVKQCLSIGSV